MKRIVFALLLTAFLAATPALLAQPAGWSSETVLMVQENSGTALTNYPVRMVIDTASLVTAGLLRSDAGDLRFGSDAAGTTLYPYWIESGINTATTVVWVKVPSIPANGTATIYEYRNNPAATSASTLSVFDGPYSATNQTAGANTGGVTNSQRGFRFTPTDPILITEFGKNEPNGTTRYVTLFDYSTQAILEQNTVSGAAASWQYQTISPRWLDAGTQYLIEMYQGASDGYYFGAAPNMDSHITFQDMRYCNGCTQNTFPTNVLGGMLYGYVDFTFYTRQHVSPEPSVVATGVVVTSDNNPSVVGEQVTFTATVSGVTPTGTVDFYDGASLIGGCSAVTLSGGTATCTTSALTSGSHSITATYSGDLNNTGSTSPAFTQNVLVATTTTLSAPSQITFGQSATLTAVVTGSSPTGTVTFLDNASPIAGCIDVPLVGGSASCTTSSLTVGNHSLTAEYSGDATNAASVSAPALLVVASATAIPTLDPRGLAALIALVVAVALFAMRVRG